jgi:hypothetical protein
MALVRHSSPRVKPGSLLADGRSVRLLGNRPRRHSREVDADDQIKPRSQTKSDSGLVEAADQYRVGEMYQNKWVLMCQILRRFSGDVACVDPDGQRLNDEQGMSALTSDECDALPTHYLFGPIAVGNSG